MIKFKCIICAQRLGVPEEFVGKRVRCTKCQEVNIVPSIQEAQEKTRQEVIANNNIVLAQQVVSVVIPMSDKKSYADQAPIKFKCEFCEQRLGVPVQFVGKRVQCTKCRAINVVPTREEGERRDIAHAKFLESLKATLPMDSSAEGQTPGCSALLDLSIYDMVGLEGPTVLDTVPGITDTMIFGKKGSIPEFEEAIGLAESVTDMSAISGSDIEALEASKVNLKKK